MNDLEFRVWFPHLAGEEKAVKTRHYERNYTTGKTKSFVTEKKVIVKKREGVMLPIDLGGQSNDTTEMYIAMRDGIVMQYTGLKDKNGTKIFEGDILEVTTKFLRPEGKERKTIGDVQFQTYRDGVGCGTYEHLGWVYNRSIYEDTLPDVAGKSIVIGNIYQNPELIKESGESKGLRHATQAFNELKIIESP